jgi:hypothetical protein
VRQPAAQVHRLHVGEVGQQLGVEVHQPSHVRVELAQFGPGADVGVQLHHRQLGLGGLGSGGHHVGVPDPVLRGRTAGVHRLDVPMAKPRVHPQGDRPAVAGVAQLPDHAR